MHSAALCSTHRMLSLCSPAASLMIKPGHSLVQDIKVPCEASGELYCTNTPTTTMALASSDTAHTTLMHSRHPNKVQS